MSNNANGNANTLPTALEGTVFKPRTFKSGDKEYIAFSLAVYAGKNRDGSYKKGPFVEVTLAGEAAALGLPTEKARVRVEGFLEERTYQKRDGGEGVGLSLTALKANMLEIRPKAPTDANSAPPPDYTPDYHDVGF